MKNIWKSIKGFFTKSLKIKILVAIDSLDQFEDDLGEIINGIIKPEERAKAAVDFVQKKLKELVDKVL